MQNYGCIYVAFGRPYLIQVINCIRSLRKHSPAVPVCIVTNTLEKPPDTFTEWRDAKDHWIYIDAPDNQNRLIKTDLLNYTPFEKTLYLDSDTKINCDIISMFRFLDYWDIAIVLKPVGYSPHADKGRQVVLDNMAYIYELPHWNSGVILFTNNERVKDFFFLWNQYFRMKNIKYDQVSLVEALFRSSCRLLSLDERWNGGEFIDHYMHFIDRKLANRLMGLDSEIYGDSDISYSIHKNETNIFIQKRQRINQILMGKTPIWRKLIRRMFKYTNLWVLRPIKATIKKFFYI